MPSAYPFIKDGAFYVRGEMRIAPSPVAQLGGNRQHGLRPVRGGKVSAMRLPIVDTGPGQLICERSGVITCGLNEGPVAFSLGPAPAATL
jgi:hypothetical protein